MLETENLEGWNEKVFYSYSLVLYSFYLLSIAVLMGGKHIAIGSGGCNPAISDHPGGIRPPVRAALPCL
jgi:hypothetical protein